MSSKSEKKISALEVKELREMTGASVMDCRKALEEAEKDLEKAREIIKKSGKDKAQKKTGRTTSEGAIASYVHSNKKIGTLVVVRCETDFVAKNTEFLELVNDLAMHIAAMSPRYISIEDVPSEEKKEVESAFRAELDREKKPAEIVEKIIEGKVRKHFEQICLIEQEFVKDTSMTVSDLLTEKIAKIGENIRIEKFDRFEI